MSLGQHILDKGTEMLQSLKPVKQMQQHVCTFALYSHDMNRQIETHHYLTRANEDFLQCAVYDSDTAHARLIGIEYIVSDRIFETLPPEEQKLWHSHAYEIKAGLWANPRVPEALHRPQLRNLTKSYGKLWCSWHTNRGDVLPLGVPSLMMSPQPMGSGILNSELVKSRDKRYGFDSDDLKKLRVEIEEPEWINPNADYWRNTSKGFFAEVEETQMTRRALHP